MKILVVDDRQEDRYLLEVMLKSKGNAVAAAENGADALKKLQENPVDIIISDILMPVMDGFQFCRACKSDAVLRKIPFIFYTATYSSKKDEEFALSLGADRFIVKPTELKAFLEILEGIYKEIVTGSFVTSKEPVSREEYYLKQYNERLIRKLEDKMLDLEEEVIERKRKEVALRKINRAYKVLSTCNQQLIRAKEEAELLQGICRVIVTKGGYKLAWVGFAEQDEAKTVLPVAQAGYEEGYLDTVRISWADTELGRGPTGTAIQTGKPIVSNNILTNPDFAPWRAEAAKRGYASSIALPLIVEKQALGTLNIFAAEQDAFDRDETDLLIELAGDLAYGIRALRLQAEHVRAEEALRASEERFALAVQGTNDGIWDWDIKNNSLYWSPRMKELLGYADDELEVDFDTFTSHLHPDDIKPTQLAIEAHLKDRVPYNIENRLRTKSGDYRWFYVRGEAVWDEAGNPIRMVGSSTDITERKLVDEALKESEEKYKTQFNEALDAIFIADAETGIIINCNNAALELIGREKSELVGKHQRILHPPEEC